MNDIDNETKLLEKVADQTQSELILFFILVVVALVLVLIPLYRMVAKERKERREAEAARITAENEASNVRQDKYIEREKQIIQVVTANTEVMAGLKTTLESNGMATNSAFARMHERQDSHGIKLGEMAADITRIQVTLDRAIGNQHEMMDDIKQTWLTANQIPRTENTTQ